MEVESHLQLVSELGTQLGRVARPNKDFLVKSLRQAANALSQIEQPSKKVEVVKKLVAAMKPLSKSFVKHGLLRHSDKDVKLLVAICVSEAFRIMAPEPPFEDKHLRDVFKLFLSMFAELGDTTSPYFSRRVKILETVARCKCCVIMLDIECNDLVVEMFNIFFSVVRENHQQSLINDILSIMTHILNEEVSQPLLDVILRNLVKEVKAVPSAGSQLAVSIIQMSAEKLEPLICGFLTSCSLERDTLENDLKEFYHEILYKIFESSPQMLLAVIPNLTQELLTDQVDVRIKAVNLIGKLFAASEHCVAKKYHNLFIEFKNRFSDKSMEVRLSALQSAKAFYMANPSGNESCEVLTAIEERFLDFDDRVRAEAVVVTCDLARRNLKIFPPELISKVTERLRDKKVPVRKKALQKLIELYHDYCIKCSGDHMTLADHFEQIPCKVLMLCYEKDCKEFRTQNVELIIAEELFPARLSVKERTRHWTHMFSLFTPLHMKALNTILSQKWRLQTEMQIYLVLRKKEKDSSSEEMQKKIKNTFMKLSASFPDPSKAEESLHKLNQMKDNKIFSTLEQLLDGQTTTSDAQTIRDEFLKLIGDKHPYIEFLRLLSSKCSFNILSSEHVHCILDHISSTVSWKGHLESSAKLLLAIVSIFPSFLKGSEEKFLMLLEKDTPVHDMLLEALAKAGPHISLKFSEYYPLLERICLEGTRAQSKHAVSAMASLTGSSEQFIFSKLCKELVHFLHSERNTPTILQSLGCVAQHSVSAFETQYEEIKSHIFKRIFQVEQCDDPSPSDGTFECSNSCKLKIYGLKTLVKSFLPRQVSHFKRQIGELMDILSKMLQTGDAFEGIMLCENDKPHIRLAAAKSVLRLSRRWGHHISPEIFRFTILIAKDSSSSVQRLFLDKIHRLLKEHAVHGRYACAFALAASVCCRDLQDASSKYMEHFIKERSKEARICQASAVQGASLTDYPAYIVVFLIHILAHDTDFPPEDCQDEQVYAKFCRPLFWVVQALLDVTIVDGDMDLVNDAVLSLLGILRAIKRAEDAVDAQGTHKLQILAEIGIAIVNALNRNGFSSFRSLGPILLPSSFYKISPVMNVDKANSKCLACLPFDESLVKRIIDILKSQTPLPAVNLPKRNRKCQEDSMQHNKMNSVLREQFDMSAIGTKVQRPLIQEVSSACRRKRALSPNASESVGFHGGNSADQNVERILRCSNEDTRTTSSVTAESSKCSRVKLKEPCSSREFRAENETFIGKRNKLLSPLDRCLYSGRVVGFNPSNNTHKEVTLAEELNTFHSNDGGLKENVNAVGHTTIQEPKHLVNKESRKLSKSKSSFSAKGRNRQKTLSGTSTALEVIDVDEDPVDTRSQRQKKKKESKNCI